LGLVRGSMPDFDTLDVGGGFPVAPFGWARSVPAPGRFAREIPALLETVPADRRPLRLAVEPGRVLVARAGWIVARVLHVRDRGARLAVIDAGMAELIRPALYGAVHPIVALTSRGEPVEEAGRAASRLPGFEPTPLDGPIRHATDTLGVHSLPPLRPGDRVAMRHPGADAASTRRAH